MATEPTGVDDSSDKPPSEKSLEGFTKEAPIEVKPKEFVTNVEEDR